MGKHSLQPPKDVSPPAKPDAPGAASAVRRTLTALCAGGMALSVTAYSQAPRSPEIQLLSTPGAGTLPLAPVGGDAGGNEADGSPDTEGGSSAKADDESPSVSGEQDAGSRIGTRGLLDLGGGGGLDLGNLDLSDLVDGVLDTVDDTIDGVTDTLDTTVDGLDDELDLTDAADLTDLTDVIDTAADGLGDAVDSTLDAVDSTLDVSDTASDADGVSDVLDSAVDGVLDTVDGAADSLDLTDVVDGTDLTDTLDVTVDGLGDTVDSTLDAVDGTLDLSDGSDSTDAVDATNPSDRPTPNPVARFFKFLTDLFWQVVHFFEDLVSRFVDVLFGGGPVGRDGWWER